MQILFDMDSAISSVLYILGKTGGSADIHHVYKTLYFADQEHLSKYGRSITGDTYIAMKFGPVPSNLYDIAKALRGDSFFSGSRRLDEFKGLLRLKNRYIIEALSKYNEDDLSESDIECLDSAIGKCAGKNFTAVTRMSHGLAYSNTKADHEISVADILREAGNSEEYANFISDNLRYEKELCGR